MKNLKKHTIKSLSIFAVFLLLSVVSQAQKPEDLIQWSYEIKKEPVKIGENGTLVFKATIADDWYLYATDFDPNLGPILTEFTFSGTNEIELKGETESVNSKKKYDDIWGGEYSYFKKKGTFEQDFIPKSKNASIKVRIEGQVCSEVTGQCLLFEKEFEIDNMPIALNTLSKSDNNEQLVLKSEGREVEKPLSSNQKEKVNIDKKRIIELEKLRNKNKPNYSLLKSYLDN